ncbi:hypothetical protein PSTG_19463, partial [Puccinia striiformis f. sp. tritici PST-78]
MSFEEMVIIVEDVINRAMSKNRVSYNNCNSNQREGSRSFHNNRTDNNKAEQDSKKTTPANKQTTKCHFCQQTGHYSKECPKKRNRINNLNVNQDDDSPAEENDPFFYDHISSTSDVGDNDNAPQDNRMVLNIEND